MSLLNKNPTSSASIIGDSNQNFAMNIYADFVKNPESIKRMIAKSNPARSILKDAYHYTLQKNGLKPIEEDKMLYEELFNDSEKYFENIADVPNREKWCRAIYLLENCLNLFT